MTETAVATVFYDVVQRTSNEMKGVRRSSDDHVAWYWTDRNAPQNGAANLRNGNPEERYGWSAPDGEAVIVLELDPRRRSEFTAVLGKLVRESAENSPLFAVEYTHLEEPRRFNWDSGPASRRDELVAIAKRDHEAGSEGYERHTKPMGWEFVPDEAPAPEYDAEVERIAGELRAATEREKFAKLRELIVGLREAKQLLADSEALRQEERTRPIDDVTDERLAPVWEKAAEAATENGFCPEYDLLCDSLGIPGREHLWRGVVTVTLNAYVYATSTNSDDAEEAMERRMREALIGVANASVTDGSIREIEVESIDSTDVDVY